MGTTALVGPEIEMGSVVLQALEDAGVDVSVAMWAVLEEYGDWRMIVASPDFREDDVRGSYRRVVEAIQGKFFSAPTITILKMSSPFIQELRHAFSWAPETYGIRLGGQVFGGKLVQDAFVYRIR